MNQYEMTFLLNEEKEKEEEELKNIKSLLNSLGGKIIKEESWGKKTLAYPIKKNYSALFYNWTFKMEKKNLSELKRKLNYNEKLIRYLLLLKD